MNDQLPGSLQAAFTALARKALLTCMVVGMAMVSTAQTTLIDPAGDGGFENGATFAANGWTVANNGSGNDWYVGTVPTAFGTGNNAYISSDLGVTHNYVAPGVLVHFYRDILFPAGETSINLSFDWIGQGESIFDHYQVSIAPTAVTPLAATGVTGSNSPITNPLTAGPLR